jgi:tRNA-2-methylthio-N6-dimethylallyladenosine synthase
MNVNDSEKVAGLLTAAGYQSTEEPANADFVFVNTCAVRENASEKLYHQVGRLRQLQRTRPDLRIGVGGCVAQLEGTRILERAPEVDVLVGTHTFGQVVEMLGRVEEGGGRQVDLDRRVDPFRADPEQVAHSSSVRAFVTVMEGCNHVCSFCVVPRTRGPEVNRSPEEVVAEVRSLVARGFSEVMLLGQTIDAYRFGDVDFAGLLARVDAVPGLRRLRFTTSHPEHVTRGLAEALRDLPKVCPYLHLPVQSGSDRILASMRRGYTRAQYEATIALLREHVPGLAITSDVIVGYPGETEAEFEETVALVEAMRYDGLFVFAYSPRPGTTARLLADDVPVPEKSRRVDMLNRLQQRRQHAANLERIGTVEEVLIDTATPDGRVSGRTRHFRIVHLDGDASLVGSLVEAEISGAGPNSLQGSLRQQPIH